MSLERLLLPSDLVMSPVASLPRATQQTLGGAQDDVVLTRPRHRQRGLVVDADTARLLEGFREPTTVPEAVLLHAVRTAGSAEEILTNAFPVLQRLREARYLVLPGEAALSATRPLLEPGAELGPWRVERSLQVFDDADVYRATGQPGECAVKVVRPGAQPRTLTSLRREREVLELLERRGSSVPRVLGHDFEANPAWLAISWAAGQTAEVTAARLRRQHGPCSLDAFRLCAQIVRAYADLHTRGVLHGDVHPANIMVEANRVVTLIDFGLAAVLDGTGPGIPRQRGGIGWAFEPELAAAAVAGRGDVPTTRAGEQYSLAAVVFYLLSGTHHLDLPVERQAMFAAILEAEPRRLADCTGIAGLDVADSALRQALSGRPEERLADLGELAAALDAQADVLAAHSAGVHDEGAEQLIRRLVTPQSAADFARRPAPRSTLSHGAAGIAAALLRLAQLREDAELLAAADAWTELALTPQPNEEACHDEGSGITTDTVSAVSLFHSTVGIYMTDALIAHALGDLPRATRAANHFIALATRPAASNELVNGDAGLVTAAALLVRALRTSGTHTVAEQLAQWLRDRSAGLAPRVVAELNSPDPKLALAHGAAGAALAVVLAERTLSIVTPATAELTQGLMARVGGQPVAQWSPTAALRHSWCNGSAGMALALAALGRHTGSDEAATVAVDLATHAAEYHGPNASLCCGAAGIGLVLLQLHRITGDARWRDEAARMAEHARRTADLAAPRAHSLHKGALAAVLLANEVRHADRASFPALLPELLWT